MVVPGSGAWERSWEWCQGAVPGSGAWERWLGGWGRRGAEEGWGGRKLLVVVPESGAWERSREWCLAAKAES